MAKVPESVLVGRLSFSAMDSFCGESTPWFPVTTDHGTLSLCVTFMAVLVSTHALLIGASLRIIICHKYVEGITAGLVRVTSPWHQVMASSLSLFPRRNAFNFFVLASSADLDTLWFSSTHYFLLHIILIFLPSNNSIYRLLSAPYLLWFGRPVWLLGEKQAMQL